MISLPNIERVFDSNLPNTVDLFVSAAASEDFKFQAWFLEVQDILRRMRVKQKLVSIIDFIPKCLKIAWDYF